MIRMKRRYVVVAVWLALHGLACSSGDAAQGQVHSTFEGRLSVRTEIDTSQDYRGFEVLLVADREGLPDTLGIAMTDSTGHFRMNVTAEDRGVYRLVISRNGEILTISRMAIADGDSATLTAAFPIRSNTLRVRSAENAALLAYENARTQHQQTLVSLVQDGDYDDKAVSNLYAQTTMILWEMQRTFPSTMGSEVAAAEAIALGVGWNDSLAVARALELPPDNLQYGELSRAARQAQARLAGQEAALTLLDELYRRAQQDDHRAEITSERVLAHLDSLEYEEALSAAQQMKDAYPDSPWAVWADRATYEIENLLPGMVAPAFEARDAFGDSLRLADFLGRHVVLEFYRPEDDVYQRELEGRNALITQVGRDQLEFVSISLQPDSLVNEAFFEERIAPGRHIFGDQVIAPLYNVNVLPTRYLIDPNGRLIEKFVGGSMSALYELAFQTVSQ